MKRIYLYGYFGARNIGDDLLLDATIRTIRGIKPDTEFFVRTISAANLDAKLSGVHAVDLEKILFQSSGSKVVRLAKYLVGQWNALAGCSCFIFAGGTVFHARDGSLINLLIIALLTIFARLRGARVFAIGVGVAPLSSWLARLLLGIVVGLSRDFAVRDHRSRSNCDRLLFRDKVRLTADLVFSSAGSDIKPNKVARDEKSICFTIAASDIATEIDRYAGFADELDKTIAHLLANDWSVTLLSFQELETTAAQLSDSKLFSRVTGGRKNITVVQAHPAPSEMIALLSTFSVVAGMRFHSLVLSALAGVPFVGFGRDQKISGLCERFTMPFIHLDSYISTDMIAAIDSSAMVELSPQIVGELQMASRSNFQFLKSDLK
jgi:polysaccharide pyruvyl transferase WcaK-like protein